MSEKNARIWLKAHSGQIPAMDDYHQKVIHMLTQGVAPMKDIADIIMLDPGMSIALLQKTNIRLKQSRRPVADTIHTAIGLLGLPAISTLVHGLTSLKNISSNRTTSDHFRQLLSQAHHAIAQLNLYAKLQGLERIDDTRTAMLLYNIGELYVCLHDAEEYQRYRQLLESKPDQGDLASQVFGFEFIHLGRLLSQQWALPELLIESYETQRNQSRKASLINLAGELAKQAELGWYHQSMLLAQNNCASFLNLATKNIRQHIQSAALGAAKNSTINRVFPAAARLILLPNVDKPPEIKKTEAEAIEYRPFLDRVKSLLRSPDASQQQVISLLMGYLHRELGFSRVVLMIISNDKNTLAARLGEGLDSNSAFLKLRLQLANAGLLRSLLQKPQALCLNATNYRKYETSLPGIFKATCLCDNFALMSIFIGNKPIGLIYCDRSVSDEAIDKKVYGEFKTSIMTTSKALTVLAKRNTRSAAA